jgi:hypothetical protein
MTNATESGRSYMLNCYLISNIRPNRACYCRMTPGICASRIPAGYTSTRLEGTVAMMTCLPDEVYNVLTCSAVQYDRAW